MNRKEFLKLTGMSAGAFVLLSCLNGCKKDDDDDTSLSGPENIDFTLDLSQSANAALSSAGGFVYKDGVIVARTNAGAFIAVSQACSHQSTSIQYEASPNRFHCPNHGSNFTSSGEVMNGPASRPLRSYNTSLNGALLHVFS
jgi:cytochrome b6-f complex iron-sulfur subunit